MRLVCVSQFNFRCELFRNMVFIDRVILDVEETTVVLSYSFYPVSFQSHVLRHLVIVRICDSKKLLKKYSILSAL